MKKILLSIFCLFALMANAQTDTSAAQPAEEVYLCNLYGSIGGLFQSSNSSGGLKYSISGFSFTTILSNNWGVGFNYRYIKTTAQKKPEDYDPGGYATYYGFSLFGGPVQSGYVTNPIPQDEFNSYAIMIIREGFTGTKMVRYGLEMGPSIVRAKVAYFVRQQQIITNSSSTGNYMDSYTYSTVLGLSARAKMEFPIFRGTGFEFALAGQLSKVYKSVGLEMFFTFGLVREKLNAPSKYKVEW